MKRFEPLEYETQDALELEVLERWRSENLFKRTLELTREGEPFVFYEGPPTANGRPGIHHVFARTIKDLVCRYRTMQGRSVTRIAGWDTHGLPVEIEVEKELKIKTKAEIEKLGVAEFNRRCRESVFRYKSEWEVLSNRIGYWLDYERPYITYSKEYIESVWWLLQRLHEKGYLYEGHKVLPYCWRCETALSSHELALGYEQHRSPSIYVLFELERSSGEPRRYLLVWTTTPWTLPSNVAVAVNPEFDYVELDVDGKRVIVERSIAEHRVIPGATHGKPLAAFPRLSAFKGRELVGRRYRQLLDAVEVQGDAFRVVAGDFVTSEEGTGLVHLAPAFGADDYVTVQREGLAFFNVVDEAGRFSGTKWDEINGKVVFEANPLIAERLEREGKLFGRYQPEGYEHSYPFCWRCGSPLIYYARKSWFVRTTAFKERMLEINASVNWYPPEVGSGRFGEWLANNVDWALSRDRYWGTPLPVWRCTAQEQHCLVVGSYAELEGLLGRPLPDDFDPHKPFIDQYTFRCPDCGESMRRVPEVIDAWFDSGAMPGAQWHYPFEHAQEFERHFPADFICEGLDQTRGWFYSLLAIAVGVYDRPAYRNVIVNGLLLDAHGRKMSKHLGNVVDPGEVVRRYGADAVRVYLLASSQVWLPKRFDPEAIADFAGGFLNRLKNTYNFFALYAGDWHPEDAPPLDERPPVDRWLLGKLDRLVASVGEAWSGYDVTAGTRAIMEFADNDLSNWYVRVNRARFWAPDSVADAAAVATLFEALVTLCRLMAPAAPFTADAIHRRLVGESVHLARFPEDQGRWDPELDSAMEAVRTLASLARAARERKGLRVRQPLGCMRIAVPGNVGRALLNDLLPVLAQEVNVKTIELIGSEDELVRLKGRPNFASLGKVYGKRTPVVASAVSRLSREQLLSLEQGASVTLRTDGGEEFTYRPEDVRVEREVVSDWLVERQNGHVVALDPRLDEELRLEGIARELVHRIQRLRKEAGYDYTTRIELGLAGSQEILKAVRAHGSFIARETLARGIRVGEVLNQADLVQEVDVDGLEALISLKRHGASQK
ncbi:MAG: isoleucine--tRNA ligase [Gemmatimonadales bacterium]|nr:MAG: isoleucine--tRNA ligase [Gemmatimonadales bacterium]